MIRAVGEVTGGNPFHIARKLLSQRQLVMGASTSTGFERGRAERG